jgi:hypothetical protein
MRPEPPDIPLARRTGLIGLTVGVVAALLSALGWWLAPQWFFSAYLVGLLFWLGISLGSMAINMIHHLTGGGWGMPLRRVLETAYAPLPLLALLFVPLLFAVPVLYEWADPEHVAHDEIIQKKTEYLNVAFFQVRAAIYFALWIVLGFVLNLLSRGTDPAVEPLRQRRLALLSGPGLIVWALTITGASVDWVMSLEPHWFSSMYGVLYMAGFGVSGLAFAILVLAALRETPPWTESLLLDRWNDLGNFLLAFTLFWSYVSLMQYLIIWSGNLPEETPWYLHRGHGGWQFVALLLIGLHFILPFLLLLSRQTKRTPRRLVGVAALLLAMRLVDLYWLVMPALWHERFFFNPLVLITPLAIGGLWLAVFCWRLPARAAWPVFELSPQEEAGDELVHHSAH